MSESAVARRQDGAIGPGAPASAPVAEAPAGAFAGASAGAAAGSKGAFPAQAAAARIGALEADVAALTAALERTRAHVAAVGLAAAARRPLAARLTGASFDTRTQFPVNDLRPDGRPHGWSATGHDPQLLIPVATDAPAVRVRYAARHDAPAAEARWQLFIDYGDGFEEADSVVAPAAGAEVRVDMLVPLRAPARCFRLDPIDQPGDFVIERFEMNPTLALGVRARAGAERIGSALRRKRLVPEATRIVRALAQGDARPLLDVFALPDPTPQDRYLAWMAARAMTPALRAAFEAKAAGFALQPTFSILMPTWEAPLPFLEKAVDSILAQTWPRWELLLVDDGSPSQAALRPELERIAARDARIRLRLLPRNLGISGATNAALAEATGEFVALVDHDDALAPHALHAMAERINCEPDVDWLYSDEDKIDAAGRRFGPFFKPDWSPAFFTSCMYTCHLGVYRRSLVESLGGFRSDYDFAQDYDLALRVASVTDRVAHVADVLYHWRTLPTSTASGAEAKPVAETRARAAVQDYLDRGPWPGEAMAGRQPGMHRVRFAIRGAPLVSLAILSAGRRNLSGDGWFVLDMVRSIRAQTTYAPVEIVIADNGDFDPDLDAALAPLDVRRTTYRAAGRFNLPEKMNHLVEATAGEHVVLLNDDMVVLSPDWVQEMLMWAQQDGVAGVGAMLLFPDARIQHAGVSMLGQGPSHLYYLHHEHEIGHGGMVANPREMAGVTGACMMVRRADYLAVGGFDPAFRINYNDVDFCLRLRERTGGRIIWTPYAVLRHFESVSRETAPPDELNMIRSRWPDVFGSDPYYNIHLSQYANDHSVTVAPRSLAQDYGL